MPVLVTGLRQTPATRRAERWFIFGAIAGSLATGLVAILLILAGGLTTK